MYLENFDSLAGHLVAEVGSNQVGIHRSIRSQSACLP